MQRAASGESGPDAGQNDRQPIPAIGAFERDAVRERTHECKAASAFGHQVGFAPIVDGVAFSLIFEVHDDRATAALGNDLRRPGRMTRDVAQDFADDHFDIEAVRGGNAIFEMHYDGPPRAMRRCGIARIEAPTLEGPLPAVVAALHETHDQDRGIVLRREAIEDARLVAG